jgi:HK97 family phage prohead protease/HK97 family phage major capsid protein
MNKDIFYINSSFETKSFSKGKKSLRISGYANTITKDRSGDIVTAEAWAKGVENFRKNPVMLYQHKHDQPIGRFDKITVDKKGIYVEGSVSEAAEKTHGIHTLIKDGALKSFSVGFRVKDAKFNRTDESMIITDVELLEISVVSVPCNQDSLFSIKKSFDSNDDYKQFISSFEEASEEEVHKALGIRAGYTTMSDGHYHSLEIDENGNGVTTYASHMQNHTHKILNGKLLEADGHTHSISVIGVPTGNDEESSMANERPLSPSELEAVADKDEQAETIKSEEVITEEETLEQKHEETIVEKTEELVQDTSEVEELGEEVEEFVSVDPNEPIPFINLLSASVAVDTVVTYESKTYKVLEAPSAQNPFFKFLEIDASGNSCDNTINVNAEEILNIKNSTTDISEDEMSTDNLTEKLHKDSTKENDTMAEQVVETINLETAKGQVEVEAKKEVAPATVAEPRVADLVEKTGEALIKEADAKDKYGEYTPVESEMVAELKAQVSKYKDEIKSLQTSKMQFSENSRTTSQFNEKEMANAVLLAKMLNKRDVFDTKYGSRMKAVTTVDQFLSNFSSNIYTEMEQQLVIAPMFNRMAVDAKTFRVPVADEDTDGDVAMFRSGTYATGIGDTTNVPTSNQNTISSVEFTPHKFMATTHLAKDEEEDTVLPLLDFLRAAATRRLARAIDKSILRGTGALTGFTASPTNTITAGTGYASVIEGITNLTGDASLTVSTGSSTDKADPSDIAAARTQMGKYGLQLGNDLVFVTSIEGYNNLVTTSDFQTVDKFGPNATYLTGSVGAVYGIPIAISEFLDGVGSTGNHLGVLLYKPGFMIAERRGIEIESEYEPRQQVTAMYMSTRFDFKALTTNSSAALDATKYAYASTIVAG